MEHDGGTAERLIGQTRALKEDVRGLASELSAAAEEIRAKMDISHSVQEHPIRTVCLAAGVGYILGGGLFSRLTGRFISIGMRAMVVPLIKSQLDAMISGVGRQPS